MQGNLLTVEEFCARAGIGKSTFRKYRHKNPDMFPPAIKKGTQPFFTEEQVEQFKACAVSKRNNPVSNVVPLPDAPALVSTKGDTLSEETAEEVTISQGSEEDADEETFKAVIPSDNNDDPVGDERIDQPAIDKTAALDEATQANRDEVVSQEDVANHAPIEALTLEKKNDSEAPAPMCNLPAVQSPPFIENLAVPLEGKSLQELADEGRLCFERADDHIKQGLMYYVEGGRRLIEAKRRLPHGQWQPWLKEHFSFSQDTATNRMKLAERFAESKSETFRNLKPSTAIKLLALPSGDETAFIEAQTAAGKPIETQSAREVQSAVKQWKQAKEVGGEYINVTGTEKNNQIVEELNHAATSQPEPRQDVSLGEPMSSMPPPKNSPETLTANDGSFSLSREEPPTKKELPPIARNRNSSVDWHTPADIIAAVHETLGHIDLDPASSAIANQTVKADKFFSVQNSGLDKDWRGNIFMNPPFTNGTIELFVDKLIGQLEIGNVKSAIVLTDAATDTCWFRKLAKKSNAFVLTKRINFLKAGTKETGSPTRGQAVFYIGDDSDLFYHAFAKFGLCCKVVMPLEGKKSLFDFEEATQ